MTKTQQRAKADKLFSLRIRSRGRCEAEGYRFTCSMQLQCCHIVPRKYMKVRWDDDNALAMCGAHHTFFTHNPLEWVTFVEDKFPGRWESLRLRALADGPKPDYAEILTRLAS